MRTTPRVQKSVEAATGHARDAMELHWANLAAGYQDCDRFGPGLSEIGLYPLSAEGLWDASRMKA